MQNKLILALLIVGMVSAGTVGGVAYWALMRDFRQGLVDQAFKNYHADMSVYLSTYGDWDSARRQESFDHFVRRRRPLGSVAPPTDGDPTLPHRDQPPFHFMLADLQGRVLKGTEEYPPGSRLADDLLQYARPLTYGDGKRLLAIPIGEPILTPRDLDYLAAMRQSLYTGIGVALLLAIGLGLGVGRKIGKALRALTYAIQNMQEHQECEQHVPVRSRDELGELADAFNRMNSDLCQVHRELRELSIHDPLTGLYNRRHFAEQARTLYQHALRYRRPLVVMIGDLDHFKDINDGFSHAIGDEVLRRVARLLESNTRKSDLIARHGGEEFVILFPEATLDQVIKCCESLREKIECQPWNELDPQLQVTMSMGLCDELEAGSVERMIACADRHLYNAKHSGRNRVMYREAVTY